MRANSQQIGQSQKVKLLSNISKQIEQLIKVTGRNITTTTTTTTVV